MCVAFITFTLSVLVFGVLTFIALTAGLGSPDGGRKTRILCTCGGVVWSLGCAAIGGLYAILGLVIAVTAVFLAFRFSQNRVI